MLLTIQINSAAVLPPRASGKGRPGCSCPGILLTLGASCKRSALAIEPLAICPPGFDHGNMATCNKPFAGEAAMNFDVKSAEFWDPQATRKEVLRVFDVCHGCRVRDIFSPFSVP